MYDICFVLVRDRTLTPVESFKNSPLILAQNIYTLHQYLGALRNP